MCSYGLYVDICRVVDVLTYSAVIRRGPVRVPRWLDGSGQSWIMPHYQ